MPRKRKQNKRANNTGTLHERTFKRKDGSTYTRWQASVTVGYDDQGKQRRKTVYGNSQAEAIAKLQEVQQQINAGTFSDNKLTVNDYFKKWLTEKERQVKPSTMEQYEYVADRLKPHIGRVKLDKLTPLQIQNALSAITDDITAKELERKRNHAKTKGDDPDKVTVPRGMGSNTANKCRTVLLMAYKQAIRWQLVTRNPVEVVDSLKIEEKELELWTPAEAARFIDTARSHRLFALFYLGMATGLRRGELLGLRWQDVQGTVLQVKQSLVKVKAKVMISTPKTARGKRRVSLSPDVVEVLAEHKLKQDAEKAMLGEAWRADDLVFTSEVGTPINPDNLKRVRHKLMDDAQVPRVRLHDLRHLHASIAIKNGTDPKVLADRLGHARASFTLDRYTHLFDEQREQSAVSLLDFLPKGTAN